MFKRLVLIIAWCIVWPLVFVYFSSSRRKKINKDIENNMRYREACFTGLNALVWLLFCDKSFRTLFYYRIGRKKSAFVKWIWKPEKTFCISTDSIGGGCFCFHPTSTYLNAKRIGINFSCRQNTTIGNKSDSKPSERPIIGDNVKLGANVVIIGNIRVGDNVIVGAGAVVVKDVPSGRIVVGNPARELPDVGG